jgi:hypothetical protein
MRVARDLIGGNKPPAIDLHYNGDVEIDSTTLRYKGSLCKFEDYTGAITNGNCFVTWADETTSMENVCGILEEEQPITGNYLPNDAAVQMTRRKITPIFPSTVIEAEYAQNDPAGTDITDTSATCASGAAAFTVTVTTADVLIGGWIYMTNGAADGFLSYITDNSTSVITLASNVPAAVVAADNFLVIQPACGLHRQRFDDHMVHLASEVADSARTEFVIGLDAYISAPGIPKQRLNRDLHDGLTIANARFYHEFVIPGGVAGIGNAWAGGKFS